MMTGAELEHFDHIGPAPVPLPQIDRFPETRSLTGNLTSLGGRPTKQSLALGLSIIPIIVQSISALTVERIKSKELNAFLIWAGSFSEIK